MNENVLHVDIPIELYSAPWVEKYKSVLRYGLIDISDDDGNEIGSICGGIGDGVLINDVETGTEWCIPYKDLWHLFKSALENHEFDKSQTDLTHEEP